MGNHLLQEDAPQRLLQEATDIVHQAGRLLQEGVAMATLQVALLEAATVEVVVDTAGTIQDMVVGWDLSLEGTGVHGRGQVEEGMAAAVMGEVEAAEVVGVDLLQ